MGDGRSRRAALVAAAPGAGAEPLPRRARRADHARPRPRRRGGARRGARGHGAELAGRHGASGPRARRRAAPARRGGPHPDRGRRGPRGADLRVGIDDRADAAAARGRDPRRRGHLAAGGRPVRRRAAARSRRALRRAPGDDRRARRAADDHPRTRPLRHPRRVGRRRTERAASGRGPRGQGERAGALPHRLRREVRGPRRDGRGAAGLRAAPAPRRLDRRAAGVQRRRARPARRPAHLPRLGDEPAERRRDLPRLAQGPDRGRDVPRRAPRLLGRRGVIAHWDDVPWAELEAGDMRADVQDLGRAAGTVGVGLRRARAHPGRRSATVHRHSAEEELYYVLGGSGLAWRDGETHEVGAGDVILEPPAAAAHTLVGGEQGLDVLAFGPRLPVEVGEVPRAGIARIGATWVEATPGPGFAREAEAGPLELPPEPSPRPQTIVVAAEVEGEHKRRGSTDIVRRNLGQALGARTTGMRLLEIAPGARGYPHHCHSAEEELFVVLAGEGTLRLGDERLPVRRGHVISRPAGTGVAHSFWGPLTVLAYGPSDPRDLCFYPDSNKILAAGLNVVFRVETLDYWDGEE